MEVETNGIRDHFGKLSQFLFVKKMRKDGISERFGCCIDDAI
jgi:hypothetical protein